MSLDADAGHLAEHLAAQEYIEVFAHHDADGVAAGAILCLAAHRLGIGFRLRVVPGISTHEISGEIPTLLCDLGSGMEDLPHDTMVVDHHNPRFGGPFHVNPRNAGIDGERELSGAGTAYRVALHLGDNRDLSGLALAGVIGDRQDLAGENLSIFNEAVAEGIVSPSRGLRIVGRDPHEWLSSGIDPYIPGVSGEDETVGDLISRTSDVQDKTALISLTVLAASPTATPAALSRIYGDIYYLPREVISDAHTLTALVDACGKDGQGAVAASLCMRSTQWVPVAWETAIRHRLAVIGELKRLSGEIDHGGVYEVTNAKLTGDIADALASDLIPGGPVIVMAQDGTHWRISARSQEGSGIDLGAGIADLAAACNGRGGGHRLRAGAIIPHGEGDHFRAVWKEAVMS
ncbi:MAG: DHHA1 domain-containing protein [Methanomicrobiales archaeon]|jgi:single-stranded DNA-specific DHH superfamily exonuclease|nr:DHHA1 domain-containing protein [Methanomicrobiales archaeon]